MVIGIVVGYMIFISFPDQKTATEIAGYISIISDVFLRLIKMLIGPLVFSTLVVGIAHMGDAASVGRVFGKALGWFITASLVSLVLGLVMANLLQPGDDLGPAAARHRRLGQPGHLQVHPEGLRHPPGAEVVRRGHGQQRDPADRGVLDVLRRRARLAGREGEDADRRGRRARPRHAEDHRLRDEAGAAGGVRRHGRHGGGERPGDPAQVRRLHGRLLHRPVPAVGHPGLRRLRLPRARACSSCWC